MASKTSISDGWRERGNVIYRTLNAGLSPSLSVKRSQETINCYSRALSSAEDNIERSSAHKNLAMANWKMATAQIGNGAASSLISFYFNEALSYFQKAHDYGIKREFSWLDSLMDASLQCWYDVCQRLEEWDTEAKVKELHRLAGFIIDHETKAREYIEIANKYFNLSLYALGERKYQQSLTWLKECYFPLEEAQKYGGDIDLVSRECAFLNEDIYIQTCVAESIQERVKAESLLEVVTRDEEILNVDIVWEVIDSLRLAAQLTRDRDLELEAMALTSLGKVFDVVLKMKDRAKPCLLKALELANSMVPRNFSGVDWYEFARSTVARYQMEQVRAEEDRHQKDKEEVMALIKEEVDTLKKKHKSLTKLLFLKFVYATHPPKNPEHKMKEVSATPEPNELKKLYQLALIHYHPDRVNTEVHGKTWKVLSEEIAKLLSAHYGFFKGCEPDPSL